MKAFYTDHFVLPLPPGHRFPMEILLLILNPLYSKTIDNHDEFEEGFTKRKCIASIDGKKYFIEYDKQTEYKDYMNTYIENYVKHYPIKDNIPEPYILISLKWIDLINKLCKIIKKN